MLKKLLVIFLMIACLTGVWLASIRPEFYGFSESFEIYSKLNSSGEIYKANVNFFHRYGNIKGESFKCEKDSFNIHKFIDKFDVTIIFTEEIDEGTSYYGYSNKIKYKKQFNGRTINVHIFVGKEQVTVGSPIIFGSF